MVKTVKLRATSEGLVGIYVDGVDYTKFGGIVSIERNSHVEPIPNSHEFRIEWCNKCKRLFGVATLNDEEGKPFRSYGQAVACEVRMLESEAAAFT